MRILTILAAWLALGACTPRVEEVVFSIDDVHITRHELNLRARHEALISPSTVTFETALGNLVYGYMAVKVLDKLAKPVTPKELEKEFKRISRFNNSDELTPIFSIYRDTEQYLRVGLLPDFALTLASGHFDEEPDNKISTKSKSDYMLSRLQGHADEFDSLARMAELTAERMVVTREGFRYVWEDKVPPDFRNRAEAAQRILAELKGLKPGEVKPEAIPAGSGFRIVKVISVGKNEAEIALMTISPPVFLDWFWIRAGSIEVDMPNAEYRKWLSVQPWYGKVKFKAPRS